MKTSATYVFLATCMIFACEGTDVDPLARGNANQPAGQNPDATGPGGGPEDPSDPAQCKGRDYAGFENQNLAQERAVQKVGTDRQRIKPFVALRTEYARVLGVTPASLEGAASTFAEPAARWYTEPESDAVALQAAYGIAFDGCLAYVASAADMKQAPTDATARAACAAMARKFWSKTASPDEIQSCADVAVKSAASEARVPRRWAYACASVLTAAGFLTY